MNSVARNQLSSPYRPCDEEQQGTHIAQRMHADLCAHLEEVYKGISGFGIKEEEAAFIVNQGGAHVYGEIAYDSMRALVNQLNIQPNDVFYDLGSGTGKFVAYMHLATDIRKSVGIELSPTRHQHAVEARRRLQDKQLIDLDREITFIDGNIAQEDIGDASVIFACATCFSELLMQQLLTKFLALNSDLRIVTLQELPQHPRLNLVNENSLPTSWSEGSTFYFYQLLALSH